PPALARVAAVDPGRGHDRPGLGLDDASEVVAGAPLGDHVRRLAGDHAVPVGVVRHEAERLARHLARHHHHVTVREPQPRAAEPPATAALDSSTPMARRQASAWPRTGRPPTSGDTPTTGARVPRRASRTPGTPRMMPIDTTGLLGGTRTTSASRMASSTPGPA